MFFRIYNLQCDPNVSMTYINTYKQNKAEVILWPWQNYARTVLTMHWTTSTLKPCHFTRINVEVGMNYTNWGEVKNTNTFKKNISFLVRLLNIIINISKICEQNICCRYISLRNIKLSWLDHITVMKLKINFALGRDYSHLWHLTWMSVKWVTEHNSYTDGVTKDSTSHVGRSLQMTFSHYIFMTSIYLFWDHTLFKIEIQKLFVCFFVTHFFF